VIRDTSAHGANNFGGGGGGAELPAAASAFAAVAREALAAATASADEGRRQPNFASGLAPRTPSGASLYDNGDDDTVVGEIHFSGGSARLLSRVASRGGLAAASASASATAAAALAQAAA